MLFFDMKTTKRTLPDKWKKWACLALFVLVAVVLIILSIKEPGLLTNARFLSALIISVLAPFTFFALGIDKGRHPALRQVGIFAASLLFIFAGFFLFTVDDTRSYRRSPFLAHLVGVMSVVIGLIGLATFFHTTSMLLRRKAFYELSDTGITIHTLFGDDLILWSDIQKIAPLPFNGVDMIGIRMRRPSAHIASVDNRIKRWCMRITYTHTGYNYTLNTAMIGTDADSFLSRCQEELSSHQPQPKEKRPRREEAPTQTTGREKDNEPF
jgi:hypothetical protein